MLLTTSDASGQTKQNTHGMGDKPKRAKEKGEGTRARSPFVSLKRREWYVPTLEWQWKEREDCDRNEIKIQCSIGII